MEVSFRNNELRRCYEEAARATRQWGSVVGRRYVNRIDQLSAVSNFQQAYKIQALRLHPLATSRRGELSITLTGRWRLIVTKGGSEESVVIEEVSNHYDD